MGVSVKIWLLAALVMVTAACGAYQFPGGSQSPTPDAKVSGRVLAVPCAPVEKAGESCAGRPVAGLDLDFVAGSNVTKAITDSSGYYAAETERGIKYDDPDLAIAWPSDLELVPSMRDANAPRLRDIADELPFTYQPTPAA